MGWFFATLLARRGVLCGKTQGKGLSTLVKVGYERSRNLFYEPNSNSKRRNQQNRIQNRMRTTAPHSLALRWIVDSP
jgi:hypothetical protein